MNITFEKGIYTIEDNNKTYLVNLNDKTIINAKTKRQISTVPIARDKFTSYLYVSCPKQETTNDVNMIMIFSLLTYVNNVSNFSNMWKNPCFYKKLSIIEKIINLGYTYNKRGLYHFVDSIKNNDDIKLVIRIINEEAKKSTLKLIDLDEVNRKIFAEKIILENPKIDKQFLYTHRMDLYDWANSQHRKYLDIFIYYCFTQKLNIVLPTYQLETLLHEYISTCEKIEKNPVKTSNLTRELIETKETYLRLKEAYDKKSFSRVHDKLVKKVCFETEKFTVVVPQEPKDLIIEGERMHHCVGSYVDKVVNEKTYIVFIRRKEDINTSYITCQISSEGIIQQYYLSYDRHISSTEDIEFKQEYQKFLKTQEW